MKVIKRDGATVDFDRSKIIVAIQKANDAVEAPYRLDDGVLHFHDADYFVQHIFNCRLVNIGDMLDNGTMINGKLIESPKSFQVACTIVTQIIAALAPAHIRGLSLLGGEPFEPANQRTLLPFLRRVKDACPDRSIWCYSGYTLDGELWKDSRARCECTDGMLALLDVLVDGRFVLAKKDLSLRFRGSANQRIINVPRSLAAREVVLWEGAATIQSITK